MSKEWWESFIHGLQSPDPEERLMAIGMLENRGVEPLLSGKQLAAEFAPYIAECTNDGEWRIREAAAKALGTFGIKYYSKFVVHLLNDPEGQVRGTTAWALDRMNAREYRKNMEQLKFDKSRCLVWKDGKLKKASVSELAREIIAKWDFLDKKSDTLP